MVLSAVLTGCQGSTATPTTAPAAKATAPAATTPATTASAAAPTKAATTSAATTTAAAATTKAATAADDANIKLDQANLDFYKGKTVTIYTTAAAGSNADMWARVIAKFLPEVIPGAKFVVQNENAGNGKVILNQMYTTLKPDGLSMIYTATGAFFPTYLQGDSAAQYDITKFKYIGGVSIGNTALGVSTNGKIKTAQDLVKADGLKFSTNNKNTAPTMANALLIDLLGMTNTKIVSGFDGSTGKLLAVQQGDAVGTVSSPDSIVTAGKKGQVKPILQIGTTRTKPTEDLPALMELVKLESLTDNQKKLVGTMDALYDCNQLLMGPEAPQDKVDFLNAAFRKALATTQMKTEVEKFSGSEVLPFVNGADITKMAKDLISKKADMPLWKQLLDKYVD
jgi:tripartite-type tricarboxylate transporter receptor subunit TctC